MPIEFNCQQCNKRLKVSDESAGSRAKCPQCQSIMNIPVASRPASAAPGAPVAPKAPAATPGGPPAAKANPFAQAAPNSGNQNSANPYSSPSAMPAKKSPTGSGGGRIVPTAVEVGDVINYGWEIWKRNLGLLVGITVVVFVINMGIGFAQGIAQGLAQQGNEIALGAYFALTLISNLIQIFLGIGQVQIVLKLLRGQNAEFGELFGGGPLFLRTLGASIVGGIVLVLGIIVLIVPGILLALFYWPFYYLIVDGKAKAMESFGMALPIAKLNVGTTLVLWLASMGIVIVGFLALCVGVLFATPLVSTIFGAAYLMMSGQIPSRPR